MSNQVCPLVLEQWFESGSVTTDVKNTNTYKKRKKLDLTNELVGGITQFKHMLISQRNNQRIKYADSRENNRRCNADDTKHMLRVGVKTLQDVIVRERHVRREYVANVAGHVDALRRLDQAKAEHEDDLERFVAEEDRVISSLRAAAERVHGAYEALRAGFYGSFMDGGGGGGGGCPVPVVLSRAVDRFASLCHRVAVGHSADGNEEIGALAETMRDDMLALRDGVKHAFAGPPADDDMQNNREDVDDREDMDDREDLDDDDDDYCGTTARAVEMVSRRLHDEGVPVTSLADVEKARGRTDWFLDLWRAVASMRESNRSLERAADALGGQTAELQASLSEATAEYMALDASKSDNKCKAVVLDDFCAVAEQITAHQIRNMEFGRILAVDDRHIAQELEKIAELKAKIAKKINKKEKVLEETAIAHSQLNAYKNRLRELERKKNSLADDLISVQRSPNKLADQSEQGAGLRAKHLKQLRIQYNKLANKRDALKLKLQKQQQVVKTPSRINQLTHP